MNHKERMLTVLYRNGIPDKVPHGDCMVDPIVVNKLLGTKPIEEEGNFLVYWMTEKFSDEFFKRQLRVRELLAFDYAHVFPREPIKTIKKTAEGHEIKRNVWGMEFLVTPTTTEVIKPPVPDIKSLAEYKFPNVEDFGFDNLERWVNESDLFVVCQLDTGYFQVANLIGVVQYMLGVFDCKEEIKLFTKRLVDLQIEIAKEAIKRGADCIWLANDYAYNTGSFLSPDLIWELDFQFVKKIVDEVHKLNKPVVFHACGNQNKVMDMIVDLGVDGLHAIQPAAQNDIVLYKKRYGDKLAFLGNIDINKLLPFGTCEEVDQQVKYLIEKVGYNGGFVLGTCNAIMKDTPPENAVALHLAAEKYGHYPLEF